MAFRLPRLQSNVALVNAGGKPTSEFQRWWQSVIETLETQEQLQDATILAIQQAQADIIAAQNELATQLAAINAVTTANAISASWMTPPSVLAAADAGTDATITIANFTRYYDDGGSVSVTGSDITGLAYETTYAVYYDDATRAATAPAFVATTLTGAARHNFASGRHYVDTITTPASGGGGTSGGGYTPPGGGGGDLEVP